MCLLLGDLHTGKKLCIISGHRASTDPLPGHRGHVLALAVTSDGKYLVRLLHQTVKLIYSNTIHTMSSVLEK